jgi:UPF0716 protein FxsA
MPLLLLLAFIAVPILELYVIITVGEAIGVIPTILLLLADSMLGAALMRSQGRAAWRRFNAAIAEGRVPGREVLDGGLVIFGGALLLTPGFVTDIFGMIFLLPPTRAIARKVLLSYFGRRVTMFIPGARMGARRARSDAPGYDFEGSAHEVDQEPPALP